MEGWVNGTQESTYRPLEKQPGFAERKNGEAMAANHNRDFLIIFLQSIKEGDIKKNLRSIPKRILMARLKRSPFMGLYIFYRATIAKAKGILQRLLLWL